MQVAPSGDQNVQTMDEASYVMVATFSTLKWKVAASSGHFAINGSGAMLLLNLIQVTESISGSVVPLAMFLGGEGPPRSKIQKLMDFVF